MKGLLGKAACGVGKKVQKFIPPVCKVVMIVSGAVALLSCVGWLISQAPPMAGAGASFQLSSGATDDGCARMTSSMLRPSLACLVMLISAGLLPSALQATGRPFTRTS